jgi:hypothetical protein
MTVPLAHRVTVEVGRAWVPVVATVSIYLGASLVVGPLVGWRGLAIQPLVVLGSVIAAAIMVAVGAVARRPVAPLAGRITVLLGLLNVTLAVFTGWRVSIPAVHPFRWDQTLDRWDVLLHRGRPWEALHAVVGTVPGLPVLLDHVYSNGWFAANVYVVLALAFMPLGPRGQRVLVAYVLQYAVLGSLLAVLVSSAGPIYYGRVVAGVDPYAGLTVSLHAQLGPERTLGALSYQSMLWTRHLAGAGLTSGITAFPSIHVSSAVLLALALRAWDRWVGWVGWAFVALILVGSVYLGWHYAVDGYASILGMLGLWWVAGRIVTPSRSAARGNADSARGRFQSTTCRRR